jgi:hypothetical protein
MDWIMANKDAIISIVTGVVTVAATIAALTKGDRDDTIIGKIRSVVDMLALNFGGAKNANAKK